MAWHNSTAPYEFFEDSLDQDFELFPSTQTTVHTSSTSLPVNIAASSGERYSGYRYGAQNSMPSTKKEEAWLSWCYTSTDQDMHFLPVMKARNKPLISDSGYGSVDYTDRHAAENEQAASTEPIEVTAYCEVCFEESEKRRYFNNNADRRKHMLTHTRPFKCDVSGCDNLNGFASPHDLARHKKTCHSVLTVKTSKFYYRCAAPSCQKKDKIWPRKDNFKAHLEGTHRYDEAEVAELLTKSECTPDSVQLSDITGRQKTKRRKITTKHRSRKALSLDGGESDTGASPSEEAQESFEPTDIWPRHIVRDPVLSTSTSYSSNFSMSGHQGLANPPSILISHDSDYVCDPLEMMDTSADFMDDVHSPYLMIGIPSSPDDMERPSAGYGSSTYADSLFESDEEDMNTDTEFDIDLRDCNTVFKPLLGPAVQCLLMAYFSSRQNAPGNSGEQSSNSSYPSSFDGHPGSNGFGSSNFTLPSVGNKRRRNTGGEDDENEDEKTPKRKSRAPRSDDDLPPLACPFVKFDPLKHDKCYTFVLKGISRVKQHLERVHSIPAHCPRCYAVFRNNAEARDKHVREGICQTVPERYLEGIDEATMRKLKRRITSKSVQESWYSIYTLLFPGANKPESPFMDTTLSAELSAFRDFCTHEGRNIVTSLTHANMHAWEYQSDQVEEFTRHVFQGAIEQLFLQWGNRRSTSEPTVVNQSMLPPTPPSTFTQDMNDMGINDTFTINDDEPLLPTSQQYNDLDITWTNGQVQQDTAVQQQWMYFGETIPMNQGHQFWNDHGVLDGMGGWSG